MVRPDVVSVLPLVGVVCVLGEEEELGLLCARRLPESVIAAPIPRIVGTHRFMSPSLLSAAKEAPHQALFCKAGTASRKWVVQAAGRQSSQG
jgi:hypothetical protein